MFVFPAFIAPLELSVLLPIIAIPVALIIFVVWHVRKINSIDETLREILKKLKNREET